MLALSWDGEQLRVVAETPRLGHWTMAARLLPLQASPPAPQQATLSCRAAAGTAARNSGTGALPTDAVALAVGLSDNSVMVYSFFCSQSAATNLQARVRGKYRHSLVYAEATYRLWSLLM